MLVVNALFRRPHPTHLSLPEALRVATEIGAERYTAGHFPAAVDLFMRMSKSETFDEFLSLPAYELLP